MKRWPGDLTRAVVGASLRQTGKPLLPVTQQVELAITVIRLLGRILLSGEQDRLEAYAGPGSDSFPQKLRLAAGQ